MVPLSRALACTLLPLGQCRRSSNMLDPQQDDLHQSLPQHFPLPTSPFFWSALNLKRPTPDWGDYFKAVWLKPYDKPPARETLTVYGASDYAVTDDGGDYTVHIIVGMDTTAASMFSICGASRHHRRS